MAADEPQTPARIRISPEEVAAAVLVPPRPKPALEPRPEPKPRLSQAAVASLVLAVLGIPLLGCLLGPLAIACGVVAITSIQSREDAQGMGVAVAGLGLGILDLVGWVVGLSLLLSRQAPASSPAPPPVFAPARAEAIAAASPEIRRALLANVGIVCRSGAESWSGSGVVVGRPGGERLVLTNRHVARCASERAPAALELTTEKGKVPAAIHWVAPGDLDVALLAAKLPDGLEEVELVMREARVGEPVFAVGNPLGLDATYTAGVVSAVRMLSADRPVRVYQVQASVNHGNSGGGLYSARGELIGLNTWTAEKSVSEGIGFAIAVADVVDLLRQVHEPWAEGLVGKGEPEPTARGGAK